MKRRAWYDADVEETGSKLEFSNKQEKEHVSMYEVEFQERPKHA
jgi:hypothetical protein